MLRNNFSIISDFEDVKDLFNNQFSKILADDLFLFIYSN